VVPLCALSVLRECNNDLCVFSQIANPYVVAGHGLGKDMWNVDPDDITYILYVSSRLNILGNF
jgi:hypothetical protein